MVGTATQLLAGRSAHRVDTVDDVGEQPRSVPDLRSGGDIAVAAGH